MGRLDFGRLKDVEPAIMKETAAPLTKRQLVIATQIRAQISLKARQQDKKAKAAARRKRAAYAALLKRGEIAEAYRLAHADEIRAKNQKKKQKRRK